MSGTLSSLRRIVPVAFDGCAGWLHPAGGRHGVLLCGPLHHEILPLYQSWHVLAAMIAEAGLPALRFDYRGTGDSLGGDRDPHRLEDWSNSIQAAARFMREEVGIETLDLVGIRLGATLAARAAADIGIERLALIAPASSGRGYVREAQARSRLRASMWRLNEAEASAGDIFNDGFVMTRETAAEICRIDLAAMAGKPAREILIMSDKPAASLDKLVHRYESNGCAVTRKSFANFAASIDSATLAKVSFGEWREIVGFLAQGRTLDQYRRPLPKPGALSSTSFREERMTFGKDHRLAGVLCRPVAQSPAATVLFLNTGGNPHLGWGRMSVEHARALAARGIASLRMDIAGLGDATPLGDGSQAALYRRESIADLRDALDFLEARGLTNFAIAGHCSGAWLALNGALADKRVAALFVVNLQRFIWTDKDHIETLMAQAYRATDSYLQEIGSGLIFRRLREGDINWRRVPGIARSMLRRAAARVVNRLWPIAAHVLGIETETGRIHRMLRTLCARGTRVRLVYSDTDPGREELARHFGPSGCRLRMAGIQIAIIANADHDITSHRARRDSFDLLVDHLRCGPDAASLQMQSKRPTIIAEAA